MCWFCIASGVWETEKAGDPRYHKAGSLQSKFLASEVAAFNIDH